MSNPTHGFTKDGAPVHEHSRSYLQEIPLTFRHAGHAVKQVEGFNAKLAVLITNGVGTMACAYAFAALALISLPEVLITAHILPAGDVPHLLANQGLILLVAWVAQTFLQLVLLSIIIVGQRVQSAAADARAQRTLEDAEQIKAEVVNAVNLLRLDTEGGLAVINQKLDDTLAGHHS